MNRTVAFGVLALVLMAAFAILVPVAMMLAGMGLSGHGYAAVFLMVFFSFAVAGGLMFLIFYSARQGYDDAVHRGGDPSADDAEMR